MTDTLRSSTLRLRRPAVRDAAITRLKAATPAPAADANAERSLRSDTLLQGRSHIAIMHNGETYQLRATRLGKLILTK